MVHWSGVFGPEALKKIKPLCQGEELGYSSPSKLYSGEGWALSVQESENPLVPSFPVWSSKKENLGIALNGAVFMKDLSIDERVNDISKQLRCMTCQNQNVYESESEFSNQIKKEISNQLKQKKSKAEIIDFMVERYGEYILLKPKLDAKNTILWTMPFIIIILSFWLLFLKIRSNKE